MKIEDMVFESRCQKCDSPIVLTPLTHFLTCIADTLLLPDGLRCAKCMAMMTTAVRKRRVEEVVKISSPDILDEKKKQE